MIGHHILWRGVHHQAPPHGEDALKGDQAVVDVTHQRLPALEVILIRYDAADVLSEVRATPEVAPLCDTTTTVSSSRTPGPQPSVTDRACVTCGARCVDPSPRAASLLT